MLTNNQKINTKLSQINLSSAIAIIIFWAMPGYKLVGAIVVMTIFLVSTSPDVPIFVNGTISYLSSSLETSKTHFKLFHQLPHTINQYSQSIIFFSPAKCHTQYWAGPSL